MAMMSFPLCIYAAGPVPALGSQPDCKSQLSFIENNIFLQTPCSNYHLEGMSGRVPPGVINTSSRTRTRARATPALEENAASLPKQNNKVIKIRFYRPT